MKNFNYVEIYTNWDFRTKTAVYGHDKAGALAALKHGLSRAMINSMEDEEEDRPIYCIPHQPYATPHQPGPVYWIELEAAPEGFTISASKGAGREIMLVSHDALKAAAVFAGYVEALGAWYIATEEELNALPVPKIGEKPDPTDETQPAVYSDKTIYYPPFPGFDYHLFVDKGSNVAAWDHDHDTGITLLAHKIRERQEINEIAVRAGAEDAGDYGPFEDEVRIINVKDKSEKDRRFIIYPPNKTIKAWAAVDGINNMVDFGKSELEAVQKLLTIPLPEEEAAEEEAAPEFRPIWHPLTGSVVFSPTHNPHDPYKHSVTAVNRLTGIVGHGGDPREALIEMIDHLIVTTMNRLRVVNERGSTVEDDNELSRLDDNLKMYQSWLRRMEEAGKEEAEEETAAPPPIPNIKTLKLEETAAAADTVGITKSGPPQWELKEGERVATYVYIGSAPYPFDGKKNQYMYKWIITSRFKENGEDHLAIENDGSNLIPVNDPARYRFYVGPSNIAPDASPGDIYQAKLSNGRHTLGPGNNYVFAGVWAEKRQRDYLGRKQLDRWDEITKGMVNNEKI